MVAREELQGELLLGLGGRPERGELLGGRGYLAAHQRLRHQRVALDGQHGGVHQRVDLDDVLEGRLLLGLEPRLEVDQLVLDAAYGLERRVREDIAILRLVDDVQGVLAAEFGMVLVEGDEGRVRLVEKSLDGHVHAQLAQAVHA